MNRIRHELFNISLCIRIYLCKIEILAFKVEKRDDDFMQTLLVIQIVFLAVEVNDLE